MGQNKALISIDGQTLLQRNIDCLAKQCGPLLVSCPPGVNYPLESGIKAVEDERPGYSGPLAGIEAALKRIDTEFLLVTPCDGLNIPDDLASELLAEIRSSQTRISYAGNQHGDQYLCAIIHREVLSPLTHYLDSGERRVGAFFRQQGAKRVNKAEWKDCFTNINTPQQLSEFLNQNDKA